MNLSICRSALERLKWVGILAIALVATFASPARAAFHLWGLNEIYSNSDGSLQFIELRDTFGGQNFVNGMSIQVSNIGGTQTHTFTIPGSSLPGSTLNHSLLFGTAGLQAAGAPAPDYILPSNFLFTAGGSISFFGFNGGAYSALPTNGFLSRSWSGGDVLNSPTNFAGQTGSVPEPMILPVFGIAGISLLRRRRELVLVPRSAAIARS